MKLCKGCRWFTSTVFGSNCRIGAEWKTHKDPYSGYTSHFETGLIRCETMRAQGGKCGPDAALYETNWQAFKRWFWSQDIDGSKGQKNG